MDTPRKAKIRELKTNINSAREELTEHLKQYREFVDIYGGMEFDTEDVFEDELNKIKTERDRGFRNKLTEYRAVIEALSTELDLTRRNKTLSTFFEFKPSPPNRRMRRDYARNYARRFKI